MRFGLPSCLATWLVIAAAIAVAALACDTGIDAAKTARSAGNEVATLVAPDRSARLEPTPTQSPIPSDVLAVIAALDQLEVAERDSEVHYDRGDWRHWVDADRDCRNTRAEVLIAESLAAVAFASDDECRVTAGEWLGPWSGEVFTDAADVDIDHHVPLGHAHESGGWDWEKERKRAYANDLSNPASLQATKASVNRAKGKQPPDEWRPEKRAGWCRYATDWIEVKQRWELTVTEGEVDVLGEMLETCDDAGSWGLAGASAE